MDVSQAVTFTTTSAADQQLVQPLSQSLSQPEPHSMSQALFASNLQSLIQPQPQAQPQSAREAAAKGRGNTEHIHSASFSQSECASQRSQTDECVLVSAFLVHLRSTLMRLCGVAASAADADGGGGTETPLDLFDLYSLVGLLSALTLTQLESSISGYSFFSTLV